MSNSNVTTFQKNLIELAGKLGTYLKETKTIPAKKIFSGPSLYFHQKAIEDARGRDFLGEKHLQMIYAVLPSWGMHRMGNTKAKVINFDKFEEQIDKVADDLRKLRRKDENILSENSVETALDLIFRIHISESESRLVSSSKTLHHILPDLIPPFDRAYSRRFMVQDHKKFDTHPIQLNSINREKEIAKEFITEMKVFIEKYGKKMEGYKDDVFNTSLPKIFDNLIVVFIRDKRPDLDD